jgi:N,N'-diacetylchitobiose transport system substrate-binding protein
VKSSGGEIAKKEGDKWVGQLSTPQSQEGLQKWVDLTKNFSKADVTKNENEQAGIFAQGSGGIFYGNAWEQGSAEETRKDPNDPTSPLVPTKIKGKLAAAPMPEIPSFLGGSNLGVTAKSQNKELAAQWIKAFTDAKSMEGLAKAGALPNATNLLDKAATDNPKIAPAALAAKNSWFPPNAEKWADVEKASILQTMLTDILTGKKTVADGAKWADEQIATTLNEA